MATASLIGPPPESKPVARDVLLSSVSDDAVQVQQALTYARELSQLYIESRAQLAALRRSALHDTLTDLPNGTFVQGRLEEEIATDGAVVPVAVLVLGLDRFKHINDTLGRHHGDTVLREVAARLLAAIGDTATIGRLCGDEFVALVPAADIQGATRAAESAVRHLREPLSIESIDVDVDASIGIALYPLHANSADTLLRLASVAMDAAKSSGERIVVYDPAIDIRGADQLALAGDLRRGVDRGDLVLHYQPVIDCRTGRTTSVEALIRWRHPTRGLLAPDRFIPLAEETGIIGPLTHWTLGTALETREGWRRDGATVSIAVNLSARNLSSDQFPDQILEALELSGTPPTSLIL
ncbi:MAG: hypothetical protein QOF51_2570, partial [Chloroflexota bacterium]|nr:hypothetical protein [Chloroflexota bacterium]